MNEIIDAIDNKDYKNLKHDDYSKMRCLMEENNIDIKYQLVYRAINRPDFYFFVEFGESNQPWNLIEGIEYNILNPEIKTEWLIPDRLQGLKCPKLYLLLLEGCLLHNHELTNDFINHYHEIEGQIFLKLLMYARINPYVEGKLYYEAFLKLIKIKEFVLETPVDMVEELEDEFHIDHRFSENVINDMSFDEKIHQIMLNIDNNYKWQKKRPYFLNSSIRHLAKHFDKFNIENQVKFINRVLIWLDEMNIFMIMSENSCETFCDTIIDKIPILKIYRKYYHLTHSSYHFATKIIGMDNSLVDYVILSHLAFLDCHEIYKIFPHLCVNDIIRVVEAIVNTDAFYEIKKPWKRGDEY